jgi:hypothetical protein
MVSIEAPMQFRDTVETSPHISERYGNFLRECYGSDNLDGTPADIINDMEWADNLLGEYFSVGNNSLDLDASTVEQSNEVSPNQDRLEGVFTSVES